MTDVIDLSEEFGTENYTGRTYEDFKLKSKDDSLTLRILPPMKSLKARGKVGVYWKTHFGWNGRNNRNPAKTQYHPFLCVEEKRDGMIIQECAACKLRKERLDKIQATKIRGKELGKTDAEIAKACASHNQWLRDHGLDGKMRYYAVDKQGRLGILRIPYGLAKKFDDLRRAMAAKGHTPSGEKGIWFEFTRTGQASPQSDNVEPHRISKVVNGEEVEVIDTHILTKEQMAQAVSILPDLNELMEKSRIRIDQIEALAACSGDPDEVDKILEIAKKVQSAKAQPEDEWGEDFSNLQAKITTTVSEPLPVEDDVFGNDPQPPSLFDNEEAELEQKLAAARAKKAASVPKTVSKPLAATVVINPATVSDEDFNALFSK